MKVPNDKYNDGDNRLINATKRFRSSSKREHHSAVEKLYTIKAKVENGKVTARMGKSGCGWAEKWEEGETARLLKIFVNRWPFF